MSRNKPRIVESRIPLFGWKPRTYFSFPVGETKMEYDTTTNNLLARQTTFETEFPEFTRIVLGSSFESRDIVAYRLGPVSRKHFVVANGVHGNEIDGINGAFKAMEILARDAEFQPFRDEWTILFIPALNPDGWKAGTRNLRQIGPNGITINLNRNFNWFWNEYVEASFESKGSAPESTSEAQSILNYHRGQGPFSSQGPVTFGFLMDIHANQGVGARYQSRDRIYRFIQNGPNDTTSGTIPDSYLTFYLDLYTWRAAQAVQTIRVREEGERERYCRYLRSRFRPHMHAYFSSIGVPSIAIEEVKVADAGGRETFKSSADYRLDYITSAAQVCTARNWSYEDATIIEKGGTNLLSNADLKDWRDLFERPQFFTFARITNRIERTENAFQDGGFANEITSAISVDLPTASEFLAATADRLGSASQDPSITFFLSDRKLFRVPLNFASSATVFTSTLHTPTVGPALIRSGDAQVDILGGGTAFQTGATTLSTRVSNLAGTPSESAAGALPSARMHAGFCDNALDFPASGSERGYLWGGVDGVGTELTSGGTWIPSTNTFSVSARSLPTAVSGPLCVYDPVRDLVWIFGGQSSAGMQNSIHKWDPNTDTLTLISGQVLATGAAYMAGLYHPGTNLIYIYGGQDSLGDMLNTVQAFDPLTETIETITLKENLSDFESVEEPGEGGDWSQLIGRWAGAVLMEDSGDDGTLILAGGRQTNTAGAIQAAAYIHDVPAETIGVPSEALYGYTRFSTPVVDDQLAVQASDNFDAGLDEATVWEDPAAVWSGSGGRAVASGNGHLKLRSLPTFVNQQMDMTVGDAGVVGAIFRVVARGTFSGDALTDGYQVSYDEDNTEWRLERVNSSSTTVLQTLDVSADPSRQLNATQRSIQFLCEDEDPVHFVVTFNSLSIFDELDFSSSRIRATGQVAVRGSQSHEIDDFQLQVGGWRSRAYSASVMIRSTPANVSGYCRHTVQTKDDSTAAGTFEGPQFISRRLRNYYTIPPSSFWQRYNLRWDQRSSPGTIREDGFRWYLRLYKDAQSVFVDAPTVVQDTLFPHTFIHPDEPAEADIMTFSDLVDLNATTLEFFWMPLFGANDVVDGDFEVARLSIDANNYIRLLIPNPPSRFNREYNVGDVYGTHDPVLRLEKVRGGSVEVSLDVVCYFGNDLRESSGETFEDVMRIRLSHTQSHELSLAVERLGRTGSKFTGTGTTPFTLPSRGSLIYNGQGYYSRPRILTKEAPNSGVLVPTGRFGMRGRVAPLEDEAILSGERDTTNGQIVRDFPFPDNGIIDTFDRVDDPNLGTDWTVIKQTGAGFNIVSNRASCAEEAFERYVGLPQHADYRVEGRVQIDNNGDIVGLLGRLDRDFSDTAIGGDISSYGVELIQDSPTAATLRIVRWYLGTRAILATQAVSAYAQATQRLIRLDMLGSSLTAQAADEQARITSQNPETYNLNAIDAGLDVVLTVSVDGGAAQTITLTSSSFVDYSAATAAEVATAANPQLAGATITASGGNVVITSDDTGPASSIQVTGGTANDATNGLNFVTTLVTETLRGSAATTDTIYTKPGRIGIYGQTGGAAQFVTIDDITGVPLFPNTLPSIPNVRL